MATTTKLIPYDVIEYLRLHHIITLGTSSFTGMPHANTVAYANDPSRIFFITVDGSQAVRNIKDNRYVSFTIDDYTTDWRKVRELQGVGPCALLAGTDRTLGLNHFAVKFGPNVALPRGLVFGIRPLEMHFVDYTYEAVTGAQPSPVAEITSRVYQIDDVETRPSQGAISTSLNQRELSEGDVIFRPGDPAGQYFVVIAGEVEVRGEGYGADQTVTRIGPGQLFGDQAALRGQRGALTAHAVTPTVLFALERDAMRDLLLPQSGDYARHEQLAFGE